MVPRDGFSIVLAVFAPTCVEQLIKSVSLIGDRAGVRTRGGMYAVRNLLHVSPAINELAHSDTLLKIATDSLGNSAFPVRGTLFDKTPGANWLVPWHQDMTICVATRVDVPGYGPWTTKGGLCHVQPPVRILEKMISIRIHLDDCDESNGALRVLPGTHLLGRLSTEHIVEQQNGVKPITCAVKAGDILLMKPLLLHASSPAASAAHRRVIHIDYASCPLDGGLLWSNPALA